ncbi:hypothetical protein SCOR_12525 [Sulfidibacter corallicola]|uniref:DUF4412 domain-containing protein n=1 Tax=Sulfidibacter corallicola TaxID=2818388 RepID=A0A8A4TF61_SULCO|nr:hypothetical protein [Sulfidibacter corallicola]QTD47844.1 hypothetical protein J3U87_19840 [Sulfidibacter corallicola]
MLAMATTKILSHLLLTALFAQQLDGKSIFYLREEVELQLPDGIIEVSHRDIWIGARRMRVDNPQDKTSLIYAQDINSMFMLNHQRKEYVFATPGQDKRVTQRPLFGLAALHNGQLVKRGSFLEETGGRKKIGPFYCREFKLNYPSQYGITTRIWASVYPVHVSPRTFLRVWYAGAGINPPPDVRSILGLIMRELGGVPIQLTSEIEQEGMEIVTTSTITVMERRHDFPDDIFDIPSDYKKGDMSQN